MSRKDELNWSTDLRRIAWWLQTGNIRLAQKFIGIGKKLYPRGKSVAGRDWQWWMDEINRKENNKAAERALTWSLLMR